MRKFKCVLAMVAMCVAQNAYAEDLFLRCHYSQFGLSNSADGFIQKKSEINEGDEYFKIIIDAQYKLNYFGKYSEDEGHYNFLYLLSKCEYHSWEYKIRCSDGFGYHVISRRSGSVERGVKLMRGMWANYNGFCEKSKDRTMEPNAF